MSSKPKPPAANPSRDRTLRASEHLQFEVQAMRRAKELPKTLGAPDDRIHEDKQRDINAYIVDFTVHVRALTDCLYPKPSAHATDVLARHYCPNWETICGPIPPELENARGRVGREIVHLSYGRPDVTPAEKQWFLDHVSEPIEEKLRVLVQHADSDLLTPDAMAVLLGKIN